MQRTLENNTCLTFTPEAPNLKRPASAVRLSSGEERPVSRLTAPAVPEMAIRTPLAACTPAFHSQLVD